MGQISPFLRRVQGGYSHWCPGCQEMHVINVDAPNYSGARWSFNGDVNAPTFSPSINIRTGRYVDSSFDDSEGLSSICHYFLRAGQLQFCPDSTHELAGKTAPLPPLPAHVADDAAG